MRPSLQKVVPFPEYGPGQIQQQQAGFNEEDDEDQAGQQTGYPPARVTGISRHRIKQGRGPERTPVSIGVSVLRDSSQVLGCRVTFVATETIPRILLV